MRRVSGWMKRWIGLVMLVLVGLATAFMPLHFPSEEPAVRFIRVETSAYQFSPGEIYLNSGDMVTIELVSTDYVHGLSVDGYDFNIIAEPGQPARGTIIADRPGVFRFRCSVACGNLHPFMIGKLHVGPNILLLRGGILLVLAVLAGLYSIRLKGIG